MPESEDLREWAREADETERVRGEVRESVGEGDAAGEIEDCREPDAVAGLASSPMLAKVTPRPREAAARRL